MHVSRLGYHGKGVVGAVELKEFGNGWLLGCLCKRNNISRLSSSCDFYHGSVNMRSPPDHISSGQWLI
jgi:hypothetical protein